MVLVDNHAAKDGAEDGTLVDFRGNPVDKSRTGGWLAAGLILGTELSERICVMGISMNLVTYLVGDLHLPASKSANIVTNFMGTLNLLGLLGGFLADAKLGRYLTVAIFASIAALVRFLSQIRDRKVVSYINKENLSLLSVKTPLKNEDSA